MLAHVVQVLCTEAQCARGAAVVARTEGDIVYYALGTGEYNELTREHLLLDGRLTRLWLVRTFTLLRSEYLGTVADVLHGLGTRLSWTQLCFQANIVVL